LNDGVELDSMNIGGAALFRGKRSREPKQ